MNNRSTEPIEMVKEHGSFLLIRAGSHFAVVEKRAGQVYPMMPGYRDGKPTTPEGITAAAAEANWLPEDEARRHFDELCNRGDRLARSLR
jgi:hypothetical protein